MTKYQWLGVGIMVVAVFYAAMSLASMAVYVFIETRMAIALYVDVLMQWAFRIICALVAGAIFVLLITKSGDGLIPKIKKFAALTPLLIFSIGSTMTSNVGMMKENEKAKENNSDIIDMKLAQIKSLEIDRALLQADGNVSHGQAPIIREKIERLNNEVEVLQSSQKATVKEKYAGLNIDFYFFDVDVESVFKLITGSIGLIALLLEFVFAWAAARMFAKGFALISQGFAPRTRDDSHVDSREVKPSAKEKKHEKVMEKAKALFSKKEADDERHKINAVAALMMNDTSVTNAVLARKYQDEEQGYTTRICEQAWKQVRERRAV